MTPYLMLGLAQAGQHLADVLFVRGRLRLGPERPEAEEIR
jgi:hypothetical protein